MQNSRPFVYGRINGFPVRIRNDLGAPFIMRSLHVRFAPNGLLDAIDAIEQDAPSLTPEDFFAHACAKGFTPDAFAERGFPHVSNRYAAINPQS